MKGTQLLVFAGAVLLAGLAGCSSSPEKPEPVPDPGPALEKPFTATGNEPFWRVIVEPGQLVLERPGKPTEELRYETVAQSDTGHRFRAARDGLSIELVTAPQLCRDTMTGMPHPRQVRLFINGDRFAGCGGDPEQLILGVEWVVATIGDRGVIDKSRATIEFLPEGRIAGNGSCNQYTGTWSLNGETLEVSRLASTRKACEPALMDQEDRFLRQLEAANAFDISREADLVISAGGEPVIRAAR
ncbi:META domain-containing protein [Marinobacter confluentis]|uniref:META domain-containing protein n=1 Tax=Marinobacter confluentis TaxID=1697557 RepID=A0A4Z1BNT8_9GAMM|nr:META domain-containing protein [Marinobacter confluentis]TGN38711.1 META domain-containing protein [Marinobacter confluentis]